MTMPARLTVDSATASPSPATAAAARSAPLLVVSRRAFRDLCTEAVIGSMARAMRDGC
jgi:hypothetical protein